MIFILFLIILVSLFFQFSEPQIETFKDSTTKKTDPNQLKFVLPNEEKLSKPVDKLELIPFPLPLEKISPPSPNFSKETKKELERASRLVRESKDEEIQEAKSDLEGQDPVLKEMIKYAGENGLIYSQDYLEQLSSELDLLSLKLQRIFARPRPYQLAFIHQISLPIKSLTGINTPSYPSRETLKAQVIAKALKHNNTNQKVSQDLEEISERINISQELLGLSLQSDIKVAKDIAEVVGKYLRYFRPD